jgi:hypothetical protein
MVTVVELKRSSSPIGDQTMPWISEQKRGPDESAEQRKRR